MFFTGFSDASVCSRPSHIRRIFWDEVLLPDELRAVSVSLVTAYRTCVDCQRPPVDTASRGVHRQAVQQLGHHLQTCLWSLHFLSRYTHTYPNTPGIFLHIFIHRPIWSLKVKKDISMNKLKAAWLPEIQSSWWHHRCMVGYHYLKGCAEKRPTEVSPLDCNAPPECNRTALDGHRHLIYCIYLYFFIIIITWWGSGAIFFLNRWNTLLSSVSCIAISSRSVSARAAGKKKKKKNQTLGRLIIFK